MERNETINDGARGGDDERSGRKKEKEKKLVEVTKAYKKGLKRQ
jgi:hypothetical protein